MVLHFAIFSSFEIFGHIIGQGSVSVCLLCTVTVFKCLHTFARVHFTLSCVVFL